MFSFSTKNKDKTKTPQEIYFENLEEAYGNLPVVNDDWASIEKLLIDLGFNFNKSELENAIEVIRKHYRDVGLALMKETKYN